jgi:general secretion pathway protein G
METNLQQPGIGKRRSYVSTWLSALIVLNQAPAPRCGKTALIRQRGFTLLELIVTLALLSLLAGAAIPVARNQIQRQREKELRRNLREVRMAIDSFHRTCITGVFTTLESECWDGAACYPKELKCLVDGVADARNKDLVHRYLRKLPRDPMTNSFDWGTESSSSDVGAQEDIFDIYSKSTARALNGTSYKDW